MFLLQMAGIPGSGKSTLAKEISKHIDVVVIDRDIIKTSMMESNVDSDIINNASYNLVFSLCKFYLSINKSVIIDTPCFFDDIPERGISIAREYNAEYKYIECRLEDFDVINNRLMTRTSCVSQIKSIDKDRFLNAIDKSKKPEELKHITVNSFLPIKSYIDEVLSYLNKEVTN